MVTKEKKEKKSKSSRSESKAEKPEKVVEIEKTETTEDVEMAESEPASTTKRKIELEEIEVDVDAPEPPSKRAKRALKKGKALPAKQDSDEEKKGEEAKDKKAARSEHSVWIGNLPFYVTAVEMRKWLVDNSGGVITDEMITRIKLPTNKEPGRDKSVKPTNKGFAYVDFTDIGPKISAIALTENDLGGRKLLIKDATSFEGRPKKEAEAAEEGAADGKTSQEQKQETNASRKIFVGNMGFKTTDDDLYRNFEKCGEIEWVKVATFEDTGKCKGFGWVKFKEPEAAAWAVKGFVKIKEAIETEEDFKDEEEKDKSQQKQFKTRKWWVNRIMGRDLKIELAEDDQARYKKRFGKDKKAVPDGDSNPRGRPPPRRNDRANGGAREKKGDDDGEAKAPREPKPLKEAEDIAVARLTGAVVKHTGSKMTFD